MIPFIVMLVSILAARGMGVLGVDSMDSWRAATRAGLAIMFGFTAAAHFNRMRPDLIRMVPGRLPRPDVLVTLTGIAELAGAIGLLVPSLARWAALGLALLLVALFPANVHAARSGVTLGGRKATPLVFRLPLQLLWIGLLGWIALSR
jgi:uncharacterized membrane protein